MTILCLTSYHKGERFIVACKEAGATVLLVTSETLAEADWPWDFIDETYYMPVVDGGWNLDDLISSVSYIARTHQIDRIVALDDLDLEKAASLREHLRVSGMGDTRTRYFRDKLAMRRQALDNGIAVPEFIHVLNHAALNEFFGSVPAPWVLKPRSAAGSIGVSKLDNVDDAWSQINALENDQSMHLIERFVPGRVYHVDSIVFDGEILFAAAHAYMDPPLNVAAAGGVFRSHTVAPDNPDRAALLKINKAVMKAMGLRRGVSHSEYIKSDSDGKFYFLETSARVGGAHIAEMVEAETGLNLWAEWGRIETLPDEAPYDLPATTELLAGIIITLARQERPDTSAYMDSEVVWRLDKSYHAGLILKADSYNRLVELMEAYTVRFQNDFHASLPLGDVPSP